MKVAVITASFYKDLTDELKKGALETLRSEGIDLVLENDVFGAYELPLAAQWAFEKAQVQGVIALGVLIRGETDHYDYICQSVCKGLVDVSLKFSAPVALGVLTTPNYELAEARCGGSKGNKGVEAAEALVKSLSLSH